MRVAALYDIHGNLPALEAVLAEVAAARVDRVVVGGDVVPGPMPRETVDLLLGLDRPVDFVHGNGDRAVLAMMAAASVPEVTYWGTVSGEPPPPVVLENTRWNAVRLGPEHQHAFAGWPRTHRLAIPGIGDVLFCHATPRSETEVFTRLTPEERLRPIFDPLGAALVVCGHTHLPFDRTLGATRVVNAGSIGQPYGSPGASWLMLGPGVEWRRTEYDYAAAGDRIRATEYPEAENFVKTLTAPPTEDEVLEVFGKWELTG
jgi:predicted phosphodiesterase